MRLLTLFRLPFALAVLAAIGAIVAGGTATALLAAAIAGVIFVLGRDPVRDAPSHPLGIVSPIDGRVARVERGEDPLLERTALQIDIRQGLISPPILCSPTEGRIVQIWAGPDLPGRSEGKRLAIHLRTDEDDDVVFVVSRAFAWYGPLQWRIQPGERVGQGQRRGLAGWGRAVTLLVPEESTAVVEAGDSVEAGATLVGQLLHGN